MCKIHSLRCCNATEPSVLRLVCLGSKHRLTSFQNTVRVCPEVLLAMLVKLNRSFAHGIVQHASRTLKYEEDTIKHDLQLRHC